MFHNHRQQGAALPIVIFIIVVMGLLGAALIRMLSSSAASLTAEVSGARAYHAAQASLQIKMTEIFPLNAGANTGACVSTGSSYTFSAPGLTSCTADVYCDHLDLTPQYTGDHFRLRAEGICSVGAETYSRVILMEAIDGT